MIEDARSLTRGLNHFLGHGRALETYLVVLKYLIVGFFFFNPTHIAQTYAFYDLLWFIPSIVIVMPFLVIASLQLVGLITNYAGYEWSWLPRFIGAFMAMVVWAWVLIKSFAVDSFGFTVPLCCASILGSTWLLWKAWNRLPIPGAPGST